MFLGAAPDLQAASISLQAKEASTYAGWLPENGNTLDVLISVSDYDYSEGELQFSFTEVSNWPGYCMNAGYAKYGTRPDLAFPKNQFGTADKPTAVALQWYLHTGADEGSAITVRWGNKAPTRFKLRIHCSNYGASGKRNAMLSDGAGCGTGCANATRKGAPS